MRCVPCPGLAYDVAGYKCHGDTSLVMQYSAMCLSDSPLGLLNESQSCLTHEMLSTSRRCSPTDLCTVRTIIDILYLGVCACVCVLRGCNRYTRGRAKQSMKFEYWKRKTLQIWSLWEERIKGSINDYLVITGWSLVHASIARSCWLVLAETIRGHNGN